MVAKSRLPPTFRLGAASSARLMLAPLGRSIARFHCTLATEDRLADGLVIVLPGIDGCTTVGDGIARGLYAGGIRSAVEIHDWRSFRGWNPFHLVTARKNFSRARQIVQRIADYHTEYPGRPVHLVGHSAGAGMVLFVLQQLPAGVMVESAVLLAAAVSRDFEVDTLSLRTQSGIWNFWSRGDLPTLGLGTLIFGTMDRRHAASAGAFGFRLRRDSQLTPIRKLHEVGYQYAMARCWNLGGHFGCTNAAFVSRYVVPIVAGRIKNAKELHGCAKH